MNVAATSSSSVLFCFQSGILDSTVFEQGDDFELTELGLGQCIYKTFSNDRIGYMESKKFTTKNSKKMIQTTFFDSIKDFFIMIV